jgi:isopentenyl-diphosphate delta-isomerase
MHVNLTEQIQSTTAPDVRVSPNPEEVQAHKYVTQAELQAMMKPDSGLLWSPWFR